MRYVKAYQDRHGRMRHYFRRKGFPAIALPGAPGSREFADAYQAALKNAPRKIGESRTIPGTFNAIIADYYETAAFNDLKAITQRTYRNVIERFRADFGDVPVKAMTPERLDELLESLNKKPGARDTLRKVLRLILKLAVRRGLIKVSPMDGVRLPRKPQKGFAPWSDAEIAQYEAYWPTGSRERLALALLLYTLQRRADVAAMGRQHMKAGKIHVVQSKTGARLWLPVVKPLQAEIDQIPANQMTLVQTQYGAPFSPAGFTNWFSGAAREAGLVGRTPHGLRKAGMRRLAECGLTPHELMALSGHANLSEVTAYTADVDQEKLAADAMARVEAGTKTSNPKNPVRQVR